MTPCRLRRQRQKERPLYKAPGTGTTRCMEPDLLARVSCASRDSGSRPEARATQRPAASTTPALGTTQRSLCDGRSGGVVESRHQHHGKQRVHHPTPTPKLSFPLELGLPCRIHTASYIAQRATDTNNHGSSREPRVARATCIPVAKAADAGRIGDQRPRCRQLRQTLETSISGRWSDAERRAQQAPVSC